MSLDLFRGVTIAGMILVNDPGDERSAYWPFPDRFHLDDIRIYGVLQRIALCYVISVALVLWTGWRT